MPPPEPARQSLNDDALAAAYARHRRVHPGVLAALHETAAVSVTARVLAADPLGRPSQRQRVCSRG